MAALQSDGEDKNGRGAGGVQKRMREETSDLDYRERVILAPMVRVSQLPLRLYSLEAGADLVYGPEIIDHSIAGCSRRSVRRHCPESGYGIDTVEFHKPNDTVHKENLVYQTCERERGANIFQIGTNDAVRALRGAEQVARDVAGVDVNMGCPKHFSVHSGMGAALLKDPERARDILATLSRNLPVPVSCKIRLLDTIEDTIQFAKLCQMAGARAITVHMRQIPDRPRQPAKWDWLAPIAQSLSVPLIANGDVWTQEDVVRVKALTGVSSVMIARGAIENPDVFRIAAPSRCPIHVLRRLAELSVDVGAHIGATKSLLTRLYHEAAHFRHRFPVPPTYPWPDGFQQLAARKFFDYLELSEALSWPHLTERKRAVDLQLRTFNPQTQF